MVNGEELFSDSVDVKVTVREVKDMLQEVARCLPEQMRIVANGVTLEDDSSLLQSGGEAMPRACEFREGVQNGLKLDFSKTLELLLVVVPLHCDSTALQNEIQQLSSFEDWRK